MDLTKELLHDVLRERNFLTRPIDSSEKRNIPCVLMEANHFIQNKLSVSVQVFMNHIGCQISDQESEMCSAVQKLEEWTFKLYRQRPLEVPDMPPMSPLFLKQALRSQLHFSPLRSWLSAKPCSSELFPVIRISCNKSSKMSWGGEHIRSHKFPVCNVFTAQNDLLWLQLEVQWLKREYYIEKMPLCLGKIRHNCNDCLVLDELDFDRQEESNSSSSDSESIISNDSLSDFALPSKWINSAEEDRRQLFGDGQQHRRPTRREHKKTGKEDKLQMEHGLQQQKRPPTGFQQQLHQQNHRSTCSFSPVPSPTLRRRLLQRNNKREETVHNSPKRKTIINKTTNEEVISEGVRASQRCNDGVKTPKLQHSFRRHAPARLVCNFEESILNGRLIPSNTVDGYRLQLTIIPTTSMHFSPQRLTLPVQVYFFDEVMDSVAMSKTPSSLHLAVSEIGSSGIKVPSQCNLQAILFNTQGSVIKIFMVGVDVRDMPPSSNTFIRQRTFFSETGSNTTKGTVANQQNNAKTSSMMGPTAINTAPVARSATLRFLIHLRLASDSLGHIRLHTDIRMLFSNKSSDLEGLENVLDSTNHQRSFAANVGGMHSIVQMPDMPKYSPIR